MVSPVSYIALRSFVEVGRQGSIKRAAGALNVTPGAVSQQIKALEAQFGRPLVERTNRGVKLSAYGVRLFDRFAPGFERIDSGIDMFLERNPAGRPLVVTTTPSFAACWLTPRLGRFTARHPDIAVRIRTTAQLENLNGNDVDLAIRHGPGSYPGLDSLLLFRPSLIVVAGPSLLKHPLQSPAECRNYPLLQDRDHAEWTAWFEANDVRPAGNAARGVSYADDALLIQAAAAGQGLALVRDVYAGDALAAGTIIRAHDGQMPLVDAYYVVVRPDRLSSRKVAAFRDWIREEAEAA